MACRPSAADGTSLGAPGCTGCRPISQVEHGPHSSPSAPRRTAYSHLPAVLVDGSHSHQGGNPLPVQCTQFGQMRQQRDGELLPNAGDAAQQVVLLPPHGALAKSRQKPSSLTRPACCQPASVTLLQNNWRGHLRWPMTSLVVHYCSAPLACFVDALDNVPSLAMDHRDWQGAAGIEGLAEARLSCVSRYGHPGQVVGLSVPLWML